MDLYIPELVSDIADMVWLMVVAVLEVEILQ
jgi:hypothetical protein